MYPPHQTHRQTFEGGMNSDLADQLMRNNMARVFLNCRVLSSAEGNIGVVVNMMGNTLITTPLPAGFCKTIGSAVDKKTNKVYFAVFNDGGYHTWYVYDHLTNRIKILLQNLTDTDGVDIFKWQPSSPVFHIDIVDGNLLYYCDGLNKGRKFNITKALDKSITGYGLVVTEDDITAYKKAPVYAPVPNYFTDNTRNSNLLYAKLMKFCYRYVYDDGEISNYSDWSIVALPPNQSYEGNTPISNDNNCIALSINTGGKEVVKVEIAVKIGGLNWQTCAIINKQQLAIADNSNYIYNFYNDGSYTAADQDKINRPYNFMFRVPTCQAFVKTAMTYTGGDEGFQTVNVDMGVAIQYQDLYLPDTTAEVLNSPTFTVVQTSYDTTSEFYHTVRYNPVNRFTIGHDVKKGNVYTMVAYNGTNYDVHNIFHLNPPIGGVNLLGKDGTDHYRWDYTATAADTATTVANRLKQYLRSIGRGRPQGNNGISNETTDGSGNVSFEYSYLGKYREAITKFYGNVTPVNYVTLKNNGLSIQVIKSGSTRQYAIAYDDDDGRTSPGYTVDAAVIRTPFITESPNGNLQQPVHVLTIKHQPPVWARYWRLLRTPDESSFIQLLIQKVIDVKVINTAEAGEYLDLVVGSLFTYQKIHPDTILTYGFEKGDRLRLIRNTNTGALYTPFFETEILSYNEVTTEQVNAQLTIDGSAEVTPSDGVRADYVGKNIQAAGYERTIVGIDGAKYVLDNAINIGPTVTNGVVPSYTFVDRRGILRIAKPPATYSVQDFSTVELYKPQKNTDNLDFKIFNDTAQKFEISDYGTDQRAHRAPVQNQDGTSETTLQSTPAILHVTEGDAYIRARELPVNNEVLNAEVIVDNIEDPNYSDFYESNLNNLGRQYAKDDGSGQKHFGSRTRFSNNYIVDTKINGLNDFDNLDREDYNDAYGDVMLTKFRENRLYVFKKLKDGWIPVGQSIITAPSGEQIVGLSDKLLGPIQYYQYNGGIGDNPESYVDDDNYQYHACAEKGTFVRIAGDGIDPISTEFGFDKGARDILYAVRKYGLRIPAGFDPRNDERLWACEGYTPSLFNNAILDAEWTVAEPDVPAGAVPIIVTQPANGNVTWDAVAKNFTITMNSGFTGNDSFSYKYQLLDSSFTAVKNVCITVVDNPNRLSSYRARTATVYCLQSGGGNSGYQSWKVLEGFYSDDNSLTGLIMPNIAQISPDAIVPDGTSITFNDAADVAPSGGADGDIWYNGPSDVLYKRIAGTWKVLNNRSANNYFVDKITNTAACPIPPPTNNFTVYARYGMNITAIADNTATGTPSFAGSLPINNGNQVSKAYTTMTAGTINVNVSGSPALPGHVRMVLVINGVSVSNAPITAATLYSLTFPAPVNNPTTILVTFETY